jgi:YegS/Rv2252/BmrU family lipid kinase
MRKAALLYNPLSGRRRERRVADVEAALAVLRAAGVEADAFPTRGTARAGEQARQAVTGGCDTVFACGGDGTIHDVVQGLVGTPAALAVIPLGTANSLACDLGLPVDPAAAAHAALEAQPLRIALGKIECTGLAGGRVSRYFTVAAGIGADAYLFNKLPTRAKVRFGMLAYVAKAIQVWLTLRMVPFAVDLADSRSEKVTELLAVRITDFGSVLRELAPGASLLGNDLRLVLFKTANRLSYLRYVLRGLAGARWSVPGIELLSSDHAACRPIETGEGTGPVYVEADGELVGRLPAEISMVPDALTILAPGDFATRRRSCESVPSSQSFSGWG